MSYINLVLQENLNRLSLYRQKQQEDVDKKLRPFIEKERYSKYSKTKIGNFLGLQYRETGSWMIFDLNGVPICTCDDGELYSTLNELENVS